MNKQIQDLENRLRELEESREPIDEKLLILADEYQKINSKA